MGGIAGAAGSPHRIPSEQSGEGGRLSGALREGVPNWQPEVQITRTAVTATRQAVHTSRVDDNHRSSPV